jgi:pimeloyl-ACP methyl ester carboxylesterase
MPAAGLTADGTAFDISGPDGAPVMVLIHGLGLCRRLWDDHLPALAAGHRVLRYDLYGHGDSAPPPAPASLTVYADQLARLCDHLDIASPVIVGFSIGGMINRRFAMDYPGRAAALIILNSPHDRGPQAQEQVEARAAAVRDEGRMATMDAALDRWFTPDFRQDTPSVMQLVRAWREIVDPESYAEAAMVLAVGVRELVRPQPPISCPTLVVTCAHDSGSTPLMSRSIGTEIDGAEVQIVERLQHLGLIEEPAAFTGPILAFCERMET